MISPSVYSLDIDNNKELKAKSISNFEGKSNDIKLSNFQNIGSNLNFYTNYNGNEKTTKLNLFRATKVDVNDDGKDDFRIRLTFYPSITRPIALALNFKLTIRGLSGYDSLDKNALFEAFVDFYRLGLFERFSKGNHIEYGYQSSEGQEIPKSCKITYQLVPHLLSLKKKPEHKVEINTNLEDTDLAVLFSYSNIKEDVEVAEHKFVALYQPVGNPKISFGRTGDSSIEFKREDTGSSYVTLRYTKTQGDNVTNFYVKDIPNHITFTSKLGKDGKIEFDTHGEYVEEIGICDDFEDPTFKVYFTNLASKAGFEWSYDRFILLKRGKAELTAYSDGEDIGFNTYLKGTANGFIHFKACSHNPLGFSFYLDFDEKYIRINRSEVELTISLYGKILNETIQAYLATINCSFELKRTFEGPFEVQFDDLGSGAVSFDLAGKNLQISNLDIDVNSPMIGGEFSLECEELVKTNEGSISAAVSIEKENNNISGSCRLEVKHGVQITNLLLKYNEATLYQGDLNVEGSITRWFNFTVNLTVEWHVTDDGGYVLIKGGSYAAFDFNSLYFDEHDDLVGAVSGNIRFKILDEVFNISWTKIDGNYSFSFDGSAVAELSDFHFWLKDKVDISVSHISGSFILDTDGPTNSGYLLINMESNPAILDVNIQDFKIGDEYNFTLQFSLDLELSGSTHGILEMEWNESGITSLNTDFSGSGEGSLEILDFLFNGFNGLIGISIDEISIVGNLDVNLIIEDSNVVFTTTAGMTELVVSEANIKFSHYAFFLDTSIGFNGAGFIDLKYLNESGNITITLDATMSGSSEITIGSLWLYIPFLLEINVDSLDIHGTTNLNIAANMSEDIPITLTITTEDIITVGKIFIGYEDDIQIFVTDLGMDTNDGSFTIGLELATTLPYVKITNSQVDIYSLIINVAGTVISLENITISGTAYFVGFLDLSYFTWVYVKGEVLEDTTITLNQQKISLVLEPGKFDIMLQQNLVFGTKHSYLNFFITAHSWISLQSEDTEFVKFKGTGHLSVDLYEYDGGGQSIIVNAKELAGAVVVPNTLRAAGELDVLVKISWDEFSYDEDILTISGLNVSIQGSISGVIQIRDNDSDWVPIYPFSSSGDVILFPSYGMGILTGPIKTLSESETVRIEAWYAPPITFDGSDVGPYTYTIDFDDGDSYQVTTYDTEISIDHDFAKGDYEITVTVETSSTSIPMVEDKCDIKVVDGGYVGAENVGKTKFTYDEISGDGKIHTWCIVKNYADVSNPYDVEWEIFEYGETPEWDQWFFDPENGILSSQQTARVNISFYPPDDKKDHVEYIIINNTNYPSYNPDEGIEDSDYLTIQMVNSIDFFPKGPIYLPDIEPGSTTGASFWLRNDGNDVLNWEITNYPTNGTWSFSALSGTIPKSGSDVIEFTVTAPNEYNVDLGGPIRIVDSDDPISEETVTIIGGTMSNNSQGTGDAEVTMDGNNVSIKIGGKNQITLDNFTFSVNGIHGKISGHYVFDVTSAYVYVNWTQGNIASLSVDGDAEFTIENFAFTLGDDVNIYVSQVITGGIHWYEGKSGNFSFVVDDTFIDVDISINHSGSNFALSGNIDVDISTGTNATMWITWDLNNENKEISIDGNLLRNAQMHVLITDLKLELNNFSFGAGLILFERTVYISFEDNNLTLESESTIEIDDLSLAFNGNINIIGANTDIEIDGYVMFSIKPWNQGYMFCVNSTGFTLNGIISVDFDNFTGSLQLYAKLIGEFCVGLELG